MPYPPPPGPRIAYDINGTIGLFRGSNGVVMDANPTALRYMNNERNHVATLAPENISSSATLDQWLALIFPVPTRIFGATVLVGYEPDLSSVTPNRETTFHTSPDTTNGDDGEWYQLGTIPAQTPSDFQSTFQACNFLTGVTSNQLTNFTINDAYRRPIDDGDFGGYITFSGSNARHVRGVKIKVPGGFGTIDSVFYVVHLYGEPDTDSSDNILIFFDPSEERYAPGNLLDWGDVPQGSTADKTFRLLNNSAAQTANNVVVGAQMGITTTIPVPSDSFLFSTNGTTWTPTVTVTSISPGATTGLIYVRRITPLDAQPSNWAPRVVATVGSWV